MWVDYDNLNYRWGFLLKELNEEIGRSGAPKTTEDIKMLYIKTPREKLAKLQETEPKLYKYMVECFCGTIK